MAVLASVMKMMGKNRPEADGLDVFSRLLLDSTLDQTLAGLEETALAEFALAAFNHVQRKPHKQHAIGFRTTRLKSGDGPPFAVLEILNDDMPYVVESIMAELHSRQIVPNLVFHPVFKVKRYGSGRLQAVVGPGDRHWTGGDQESYFAAVMAPLNAACQAELTATLDQVLEDVRQAAADTEAMRKRVAQAVGACEAVHPGLNPVPGAPGMPELRESVDFLRWLTPANFTVLGLRDYEVVGFDDSAELWPASAGALGMARRAQSPAGTGGETSQRMTAAMRTVYASVHPLVFSKTRLPSTVRRRAPLDRIGIKKYTPTGKLIGEVRLYGQLTPASYLQPVESVPVLRLKVRQVLAAAQFPPDSHNGRTLIDILENFPRDELFQIDTKSLGAWARTLLDLELRPETTLLLRRDEIGRSTSALTFVPRDQYSSGTRARIGRLLEEHLGGSISAFYPYISASPLVRTHFIIADGATPPAPIDVAALQARVAEIAISWDEKLNRAGGPATAAFAGAFPAGYMEMFSAARALQDIARIERLSEARPAAIDFYRDPDAPAHRFRAALYRFDQPIPLSERVPILENLGFRVIDERTYRIRPVIAGKIRIVVLHDMVLETADGNAMDLLVHETRLEDAFMAVFDGQTENDPFNTLVTAAALDWRGAMVLRALSAYLRQARAPFSPRYIAETLIAYPAIARDLFQLLELRHRTGQSPTAADTARAQVETAIAAVKGLDEDRILRRLLSLILAVLRTTAFHKPAGDVSPPIIAFKLASREIERLPEPRPYREIFVYSPRVEGIHLRFAPIARGGIRWSDRAQDYRTEVLGLAKAQQVKNTVIVPSGAKGGFVPKQIKRNASREEVQAEGVACYRLFIAALLDLTDNIANGTVVPPAGIVRLDGDDPYLVVAADKGTATFSDFANEISLDRGFWLGDAFASGGSAGYDHKRMGITARGAWECVKRHFREINIDIRTKTFSVIGVGDMSGDVFGNAMLLSDKLLLRAAFDHRDIFIDPSPDPASSFAERKRIAELPRSSWTDYDASLISPGGGVFSRSAKSIPITPQMKALLSITTETLAPSDLIQAILRCEADLLWFGGIGTYVRESQETDEQAGDRANDALRIPANEIRTKIVGEGANLGFTQRARIEAALRGVRINTDFIDNSAGVNTSDQEVNIKVALEPALLAGRIQREDRNRLLATMSVDVATAVLANNNAQSLALSLAERASQRDIAPFVRLVRHLEERGLIDRKLEALPTGAEFVQRGSTRTGLTRPELAVLLSWSKIALNADLLAGPLPDATTARETLLGYFPPLMRQRHEQDVTNHRLRREIVATAWTNTIVNLGGPTQITQLVDQTGRTIQDVARAFLGALEIHELQTAWSAISALDDRVNGALQHDLYEGLQVLAVEQTRELLATTDHAGMTDAIAARRTFARAINDAPASLLALDQRAQFDKTRDSLVAAGASPDVALRHAALDTIGKAMTCFDPSRHAGRNPLETARSGIAIGHVLHVDTLVSRARDLKLTDPFEQQAVDAALASLSASVRVLAERVHKDAAPQQQSDGASSSLVEAPALAAARRAFEQVLAEPGFNAARTLLAADILRRAVEAGSANK